MSVCMSVCMYACMYICMYVCVHVCVYVCMCVCLSVCMYVCMYVCMSVRPSICLSVCYTEKQQRHMNCYIQHIRHNTTNFQNRIDISGNGFSNNFQNQAHQQRKIENARTISICKYNKAFFITCAYNVRISRLGSGCCTLLLRLCILLLGCFTGRTLGRSNRGRGLCFGGGGGGGGVWEGRFGC